MEFVENDKGCVINKSPVGGRWSDGVWVAPRYDYSIFFPDGTVCARVYDSADGTKAEIDKVTDAFVRAPRKFEWAFFFEFLGVRKGAGGCSEKVTDDSVSHWANANREPMSLLISDRVGDGTQAKPYKAFRRIFTPPYLY